MMPDSEDGSYSSSGDVSDESNDIDTWSTAGEAAAFDETGVDEGSLDEGSLDEEEAGAHRTLPAVLPAIFPAPVSWPTVFGRSAELELELGFGRPHFLLERALEMPTRNIVGIEWKGRWPRAVWRRQEKGGYENVRAIHGNAWLLAGALFPPSSLRAIFLNFPDPWWKSRHQKRRIVRDEFAALLASRLQPGGFLLIQTDVASLLEEYLERLEAQPLLVNPSGPLRLLRRKPVTASSHREKKCRAAGVPIFRAMVVRRET